MEMACLFRTEPSHEEIGKSAFFRMYVDRIKRYDSCVGERVQGWLIDHLEALRASAANHCQAGLRL
jgi:hypothetical protein